MPLIQQGRGRVDQEDYFLTGSMTDFLGGGVCSRKDHLFELQRGEIKRRFSYPDFAAVLKLEAATGETGSRHFFVETDRNKIGIGEDAAMRSEAYWRITCSDGFVQVFRSADGKEWSNEGGCDLEDGEIISFLGFSVDGDATLRFSSCACYSSPFLLVHNFPEDFIVKLFSEDGTLLKTEPFGAGMTARIVLEHPVTGKLSIRNPAGEVLQETGVTAFEPGDEWLWTEYQIELRYSGDVLGYGPTTLAQQSIHKMTLKNASDTALYRLQLRLAGADAGKVSLSLDGEDYVAALQVDELLAQAETSFYVQLSGAQQRFSALDFEIQLY